MAGKIQKKHDDDLIPINPSCFDYKKDGESKRTREGSKCLRQPEIYRREIVRNLANSVLNPKLNEEQQVYALRCASVHPSCRRQFISAGLIDVRDYDTKTQMVKQIALFGARPHDVTYFSFLLSYNTLIGATSRVRLF